jgi:prepilin-type N-terminal cleavage/methylation domain-containing protein
MSVKDAYRRLGFTLIEVMITVAIVAILAAIALPTYRDHVRKSRRAEAQAFLMNASSMPRAGNKPASTSRAHCASTYAHAHPRRGLQDDSHVRGHPAGQCEKDDANQDAACNVCQAHRCPWLCSEARTAEPKIVSISWILRARSSGSKRIKELYIA